MIGFIQRVSQASVSVNGQIMGQIDKGLMVLIGVVPQDNEKTADRLLSRLLSYRVFADTNDKMNLDLREIQGGLLLVPQFTLAADTGKGNRPSFTSAASPAQAKQLFDYLLQQASQQYSKVASGQFGAHMQVQLINDGPVSFWLETE